MAFKLGRASREKLQGVYPDLVRVVERAIEITEVDFRVTCGRRTMAEQRRLVAAGASKTLRSRHVIENNKNGYACAVDVVALVDGNVRWDWPLYDKIAKAMKRAARELKVSLDWGGDWKTFKDGPHFELNWKVYP